MYQSPKAPLGLSSCRVGAGAAANALVENIVAGNRKLEVREIQIRA
ncbi:hypothetical protein C2W64_02820 [Brevibacillus laterosporus]|nr:hypothetical protein C2W64_02820 [Brevibacillus laterosporus]